MRRQLLVALSQKALELKIDQYISWVRFIVKILERPPKHARKDGSFNCRHLLDSKLETVENWILDQFQKGLKGVREKIKT